MKKINSIEGIRTLGWFGVFLCHFRGAFFPGISYWVDNTPLKFIWSGNAYVRLLFVLSGFVISYKYYSKNEYTSLIPDAFKRYFRLMPTILFAELIVYFLMKYHLLFNIPASKILGSTDFLGIFNGQEPILSVCLKEALILTYFKGASGYIGPLWTMVYEYLGTMLVLASIAFFKKSNFRWLFYAIFLCTYSGYYNYFILGMIICEIVMNNNWMTRLKQHKALQIIMIVVGFSIMGMTSLNDADKLSRIIFGIGICIFLTGVISSDIADKFLGNNLMVQGGKIAYAAYVLHWPIIESFSCGLFLLLYNLGYSSITIKYLILIATTIVVIIGSIIFNRFIEPIGNILINKMNNLIYKFQKQQKD